MYASLILAEKQVTSVLSVASTKFLSDSYVQIFLFFFIIFLCLCFIFFNFQFFRVTVVYFTFYSGRKTKCVALIIIAPAPVKRTQLLFAFL